MRSPVGDAPLHLEILILGLEGPLPGDRVRQVSTRRRQSPTGRMRCALATSGQSSAPPAGPTPTGEESSIRRICIIATGLNTARAASPRCRSTMPSTDYRQHSRLTAGRIRLPWDIPIPSRPAAVTHLKHLRECIEPVNRLFGRERRLGDKDKLGPVLYQLLPRWGGPRAVERFGKLLLRDLIHIFEFRNGRCFTGPVREILEQCALGFCLYSLPGG